MINLIPYQLFEHEHDAERELTHQRLQQLSETPTAELPERVYSSEEVAYCGCEPSGEYDYYRLQWIDAYDDVHNYPVEHRALASWQETVDNGDFEEDEVDTITGMIANIENLPPIVVEEGEVTDGWHRLAAYHEAGIRRIRAFVSLIE